MACDVFISCAPADAGVAASLADALWRRGITTGQPLGVAPEGPAEVIGRARVLLVLLSAASATSVQVHRELMLAVSHGLQIVAVVMADGSHVDRFVGFADVACRLDDNGADAKAQVSQLCAVIAEQLRLPRRVGSQSTLPLARSADAPVILEATDEPAPVDWFESAVSSSEEGPAGMFAPSPDGAGRRAVRPAMRQSSGVAPRAGQAKPSRWRGWFGARKRADEATPAAGSRTSGAHGWQPGYDGVDECVLDPRVDRASAADVDFTLAWPDGVSPGGSFVIDLWVHLPEERLDVLESIAEEYGGVSTGVKRKRGARLARGTELVAWLDIEGLGVDEPEQMVLWNGNMVSADFVVTVPDHARPGLRAGTVTVFAKGMRVSRIAFQLRIVETAGPRSPSGTKMSLSHERAFASYASEDRDRVLARVQGMEAVLPMQVFVDVDALRSSGGNWEDQLRGHIDEASVMYLFWSKAAEASRWVDWEWRYALGKHGLGFIDPVPLEPPRVVAPPPELQALHFDSKWLAYMREPV